MMYRFVQNKFYEEGPLTVNASFRSKDVIISSPSGQERYRSLAKIYFQGADAAILVYDISHKQSME